MKKAGTILLIFVLSVSAMALIKTPEAIGVDHTVSYFSANAKAFTASLEDLQATIRNISADDKGSVEKAKQQLRLCRKTYKKLEFFVEYFFEDRIKIFNRAPVYEVEEPYLEYQSPVGLQVIEDLLFDKNAGSKKSQLLSQTELLITTANGLSSYLYRRQIKDDEILESIRLELIRIITLGITGYDAPQLKTGVEEANDAMKALQQNLQPYLSQASIKTKKQTDYYFDRCSQLLSQSLSFEKFDRLQFLTEAALPLQEELNSLIKELHLEKNSIAALNYDASNIYSKDALNKTAFSKSDYSNASLIALGKKLFYETAISGNGKISCASCHQPQHYFTDAKSKSTGFNGRDKTIRNTPSLLYAAYQHHQFWDGRAASLEEQIETVLFSKTEMNAGNADFKKRLQSKPGYDKLFATAFEKTDSLSITKKIAKAIAAYETSMPVMTSSFDEYMAGNRKALLPIQIKGFNLFMGKAQCGTCHFAPVFNSLLPPTYNRTEFESLGMINSPDFKKAKADKDNGRFGIYPIEFYEGVFKTPTVRNSAKTAPYMHNGAFKTLEEVIAFYNKGGGHGLRLSNKNQTLADKHLHLTAKEKKCLISFLQSLTDKPVTP